MIDLDMLKNVVKTNIFSGVTNILQVTINNIIHPVSKIFTRCCEFSYREAVEKLNQRIKMISFTNLITDVDCVCAISFSTIKKIDLLEWGSLSVEFTTFQRTICTIYKVIIKRIILTNRKSMIIMFIEFFLDEID